LFVFKLAIDKQLILLLLLLFEVILNLFSLFNILVLFLEVFFSSSHSFGNHFFVCLLKLNPIKVHFQITLYLIRCRLFVGIEATVLSCTKMLSWKVFILDWLQIECQDFFGSLHVYLAFGMSEAFHIVNWIPLYIRQFFLSFRFKELLNHWIRLSGSHLGVYFIILLDLVCGLFWKLPEHCISQSCFLFMLWYH